VRTISWLGLVVLAVAVGLTAADWSAYKQAKLSQAWASATFAKEPNSQSLEAAPQQYKFAVKATYTGRLRKMSSKRSHLISEWGKTLHAQDFAQHFEQEVEVRADGLTVWLALQDVLVDAFSREIKAGGPVQLWIMYVGAAQQDRIFLVNEFQAVK
jgi:hypothetical protein